MNKKLKEEIANVLYEMRSSKGYTQQDVADRLGIARTTYASYEQCQRDISMEDFFKVCDITNSNTEEMVNRIRKYIYK